MIIPNEAVEAAVSAAAKALFAEEEYGSEDRPDIDEKWLNFLSIRDREQYRRMARAALKAAMPKHDEGTPMIPAEANTRENLLAILQNEDNYNYPDWAPEVDLEEMTNALAAYVQRVKADAWDEGRRVGHAHPYKQFTETLCPSNPYRAVGE